MSYTPDRAASRHARDRGILSAGTRMGPYEVRYDVRRGYEEAPGRAPRDASSEDVLLFRAREHERRVD